MKEYLWQKIKLYDWDNEKSKYKFSFDSVSCKLANPHYIALNIQRT